MKAVGHIAIIRQCYRSDGGAEKIIERTLSELNKYDLGLSVIARSWEREFGRDGQFVECNPKYKGRVERERSFANEVHNIISTHTFDLIQSHERIPGCDIYRAGDGVHQVWLEQRARCRSWVGNWWANKSPFHHYILTAERIMFEHSSLKAVICNSNMVRDEILDRFNIAPEKLVVIYNGVDTEVFNPSVKISRNKIRDELNLSDDSTVFVFVGSGFERKGLRACIRALSSVDGDVHLLVVGRDKNKKKYSDLAKKLGIEDQIHFVGVQRDVRPFYGAADALLLPTLYDPFPNVILEAMACGLAVITSHKCGGAELIEEGVNGFICDALAVETISGFMRDMVENRLCEKMGLAARKLVEPYTLENMSSQLIGLYERLLSCHKN